MYDFHSQSAGLPSIYNARELGGYAMPDGRRVRKGLLLRGGSLYTADMRDITRLREEYLLAVDFDFRTETEIFLAPDRMPSGARYIWLPAIDPETETKEEMSLPKEAFEDLPAWLVQNAKNPLVQHVASHLYLDMVMNEYTQLQYAAFFQTIVQTPKGAIYWHCSQGKDRTGLASAFLLCALGADRELILKDYAISMEFYREQVEALYAKVDTDAERQVILTFVGVNQRYFEDALDAIDRRYGSLMAYLKGPLCVTDEDIRVLRERYLE